METAKHKIQVIDMNEDSLGEELRISIQKYADIQEVRVRVESRKTMFLSIDVEDSDSICHGNCLGVRGNF